MALAHLVTSAGVRRRSQAEIEETAGTQISSLWGLSRRWDSPAAATGQDSKEAATTRLQDHQLLAKLHFSSSRMARSGRGIPTTQQTAALLLRRPAHALASVSNGQGLGSAQRVLLAYKCTRSLVGGMTQSGSIFGLPAAQSLQREGFSSPHQAGHTRSSTRWLLRAIGLEIAVGRHSTQIYASPGPTEWALRTRSPETPWR